LERAGANPALSLYLKIHLLFYMLSKYLVVIVLLICLYSCGGKKKTVFTSLSKSETGIDFRNLLKEDNPSFNIMAYPYFYNGGGVAAGDVNNDGLPDLFFTGNMVKNRLYINKGHFRFDDITVKAGIAEKEGWCTGVVFVDINSDGWQDIYICRSGLSNKEYRKNLLFINNHDLTFTEKAAEYGLDNEGYSTQASFFDYDKDGDLDMFLINQSSPEYSKAQLEYAQLRNKPGDSVYHNKLFRNDNGKFQNVSAAAGISSNVLTFSLGVSTADINMDGWPDIYVANDFNEHDYLYINNKNGSFTESLAGMMDHVSQYSMGCDVADYNNDLLPDLFVLDMLPENNHDLKMHVGADNFDKFKQLFDNGYYQQYMKNSLQKNNGDGTFSEVGFLNGVAATDWSWSTLIADFDNDGYKDIFVTNGYKRDNTNIQFVKFTMDEALRLQQGGKQITVSDYISKMEGIHIPNYMYHNIANEQFVNIADDWGLGEKSFAHGAAYADLDNDGDLDLVVNNTDSYAGVYRNNSESVLKDNYFISFSFEGTKQNPTATGAKVWIYQSDKNIYLENLPVRGYQSFADAGLVAGLGKNEVIDSIRIVWPDDRMQLLTSVKANQSLKIKYMNAALVYHYPAGKQDMLMRAVEGFLPFTHKEEYVNDFTRQFLLPHFYSNEGPCMAKADVNGDGREDVFIGGAKGQAGQLYVQNSSGSFMLSRQPVFDNDSQAEDEAAFFFDADGDSDADLFVGSGSYEFQKGDELLQDRIYINNNGVFSRSVNGLPVFKTNTACAAAADFDDDGDIDLFLGGGVTPGNYPLFDESRILLNVGKGKFLDATEKFAPSLKQAGLLHDAVAVDINKDGLTDLILAGEWMPIKIFINTGKGLIDKTDEWNKESGHGWWLSLAVSDFDKDGDKDIIAGNYGLNSPLQASFTEPVELFYLDLDGNGSTDPFMTSYIQGKSYPFGVMDDVNGQVPLLRKKFFEYPSYADAGITDLLGDKFSNAGRLMANEFRTCYFENTGSGLKLKELPRIVQASPVCAVLPADVNGDGNMDIIAAGNNRYNRVRIGRLDANHGMVLLGNGKGSFVIAGNSGLKVRGDVRSLLQVNKYIIAGVNNEPSLLFKLMY